MSYPSGIDVRRREREPEPGTAGTPDAAAARGGQGGREEIGRAHV